ncbi:hypothetical protein [Thiothrix unzii]|jgi:hypothetical protein|uniref:Uncharacterized protein n=1 Tax=Thiothrix unzii TaxID=111769 RepID=A0A975FCI5_9GAMM|nr:hypothetical protein [Thiothrix unzii]QTR55405.1 hypothetical protein J9260_18095 [Thiothrix unzii]
MQYTDLNELYADSVKGMMIGYPISKITFSSIQNTEDDQVESRKVVTLSMPTHALIKICATFIKSAEDNQGAILSAIKESEEKILEAINQSKKD